MNAPRERAAGVPTPSVSSFGVHASPPKEGTHGSSFCLACGERGAPSAASAGGAVAAPSRLANEIRLPSSTHAQASSPHAADVAAGGRLPTDVTAAITSFVALETQRLCDGGELRDTGEVAAGGALRAQELELMSETVGVEELLSDFVPEGQNRSRSGTVNDSGVACTYPDPAVVPLNDGMWCGEGGGKAATAGLVDDVASVNDLTLCGDVRCVGEEEGADLCLTEDNLVDPIAGLCLTEDYLMGAAEALMSSPPLNAELGGGDR